MRSRLTLAISLLAAASILVLAIAVYTLIRHQMVRQLDHALEDKLRFFSAFCKQNDGMIGFSMSKSYWERIRDREDPEFFQYRFQNGKNIKRSASLADMELPIIGLGESRLEYADVRLPGGRVGRCAGMSFYPEMVDGKTPAKLISIVVAHDGDRIWEALAEVEMLIIGAGLATLLALAFVTGWIIRVGAHPLVDLSNQVDVMPIGESGERFKLERATSEIQPVVERLNSLMDRVENAIRSERQFTANAAHELRNPIAGIMAQLELALSDETMSDDSRESVVMVYEISESLQRTVGNLLQLARLETGSEQVECGPVDIGLLLHRAWKPVFERAEARHIDVQWKLGDGIGDFPTSEELLRVAMSNLVENAVEYTPKKGRIQIAARRTDDGGLEVSVSNSVVKLDEEDVRRMFDRFWRSPKHAAVAHGHSGIGLNLCERIATALNGSISAGLESDNFLKLAILIPEHASD